MWVCMCACVYVCAWGVSSVVAACEVCVCVVKVKAAIHQGVQYRWCSRLPIYSMLQKLENIQFRLGVGAEGRRVGRVVCACERV